MEEITHEKREIDDKLQQDEVRLDELKGNLVKSEQLTGNMVKILESFSTRLKKLDETILPVYNQTLRLTRLQENVEKTLTWMDRVISFHHVADEVEPKIREGPGSNIEAYLKLLDRLRVAWDFFTHNNPGSVELSHVNELFDCGLDALQKEFLQLLKRHSKPVPVAILSDVANCEDMEDLPTLDHLPTKVVMDLKAIAQYLISAPGESHTDVMSVYAQIRSNQLGRSLNSLKETSQSSSLLSIPKKSSFAAAFLKGHGQSPAKRPTKRAPDPHGSLRRGASASHASQIGHSSSFIGEPLEEQLEGCSAFLASATVFLRLIQSEVRLMEQIIPPQHHQHVLDNLTKQPIEFFMREGETLYQQARRSVTRHDYSIVISCFRLIRHIQALLPEYKAILFGLEQFERFPYLLQQFERLNLKALEDYTHYIRGDPEKQSNLPKDGTVHELTSSTMWFVEQLLEFSRIVGDVFLGQSSFSGRSTDIERRTAVGAYIKRVLDALGLNMENKARSYESPFLGAIFLMNNYHFIHKAFTSNDLMFSLLENVFENAEDHYNNLISQQGRTYQRGFTKLMSFLGQEVSVLVSSSGHEHKLSKQNKQSLKDKFKGFNTELEELHKVQQQWSIPDSQLRARIRNDNVDIVAPVYAEFYRVHAKMNFTKNPDKYLKYSPESLESKLQSFFDGGV